MGADDPAGAELAVSRSAGQPWAVEWATAADCIHST